MDHHPRLLGDINGDGRADIVGFGQSGVVVALGQDDADWRLVKVTADTPEQLHQLDGRFAVSGLKARGRGRKPQKAVRRFRSNGEVPEQLRTAIEKVLKAARVA